MPIERKLWIDDVESEASLLATLHTNGDVFISTGRIADKSGPIVRLMVYDRVALIKLLTPFRVMSP